MAIRHCFPHVFLISYPLCSYLFKSLYLYKELYHLFHLTISSQKCFYISLDTEPTHCNLILPITVVGTFLCFNVRFNVVYFSSTFVPFSFTLRVSSLPDVQLVFWLCPFLAYLLLVLLLYFI